jgi:hypothetical protein
MATGIKELWCWLDAETEILPLIGARGIMHICMTY